jgi:hypothetical protein
MVGTIVVDLHQVDSSPDPNSACHFDAYLDPDPAYHFDADPGRIQILPLNLMRSGSATLVGPGYWYLNNF